QLAELLFVQGGFRGTERLPMARRRLPDSIRSSRARSSMLQHQHQIDLRQSLLIARQIDQHLMQELESLLAQPLSIGFRIVQAPARLPRPGGIGRLERIPEFAAGEAMQTADIRPESALDRFGCQIYECAERGDLELHEHFPRLRGERGPIDRDRADELPLFRDRSEDARWKRLASVRGGWLRLGGGVRPESRSPDGDARGEPHSG